MEVTWSMKSKCVFGYGDRRRCEIVLLNTERGKDENKLQSSAAFAAKFDPSVHHFEYRCRGESLLTSFLITPPSNYFLIPFRNKGEYCVCKGCRGKYTLIQDEEDPRLLRFHKPLPCYGCGIGWCSLLLGCLCPLLWYIATVLYFCKYYNRDPRERDGLVACVFAALICTVALCITIAVIFL